MALMLTINFFLEIFKTSTDKQLYCHNVSFLKNICICDCVDVY